MSATNVQRHVLSPPFPDVPGVFLTAAPRPTQQATVVLHGCFHLPLHEARALAAPLHRGIALALNRPTDFDTLMPFREFILFDDDLVQEPAAVKGWFNVDLFDCRGAPVYGEHHLMASLGWRVSNVLHLMI